VIFEIIEWMHSATSLAALHGFIREGMAWLVPGDCFDLVQCGNHGGDDEIFPSLSAREAEILFWVVEGKLDAEIAVRLQLHGSSAEYPCDGDISGTLL
jgi:hypothetical protein